jgi:uncharacterized membrane protein
MELMMLEHLSQVLLAQADTAMGGPIARFVMEWHIHPVLVNFTAALVPVSVGCDIAARVSRNDSLRIVGWWTALFAAVITPFTVIAGWLFWMPDDNGVAAMTIHKWLGTGLAGCLLGLLVWRASFQFKGQTPSWVYLLVGLVIIAALTYQGMLGGNQALGKM